VTHCLKVGRECDSLFEMGRECGESVTHCFKKGRECDSLFKVGRECDSLF